jgi:hypothetical protein
METIQNDSMHAWRIRGKNLCTYGEYAKRILSYSPNMPRDIKLSIFQLLMEQNEKTSDSLLLSLMGLNKPKTISRYWPTETVSIFVVKIAAL